jgi:hypothetical protein
LIVRSSKWPWAQAKELHVPVSQKRELEIERELAVILRELDRRPPVEKPGPKKPAKVVQLPWAPPLLLDE